MAALFRIRLTTSDARLVGGLSLFWRVFICNAVLLVAAAVVLGLSPATVSWPIAVTEAVVLGLGLAGMLAVNAALLRVAFAPLTALSTRMIQVDLLDHPRRLPVRGHGQIAALVAAFNQMLARLESERRDSTARAVGVQEAERRRVATELHDEVGQSMTAVLLQLERFRDAITEDRRQDLQDVQDAVRATTIEVARIAHELRPSLLDHLGLLSALNELSRAFTHRTGITVACYFEPNLPELDNDAELAIYRVVQESLTNVARHAHASRVELNLRHSPGRVQIELVDNGRGLPGGILAGAGLRGMRERANLVGAHLSVDDGPSGGVRVRLDLPVNRIES